MLCVVVVQITLYLHRPEEKYSQRVRPVFKYGGPAGILEYNMRNHHNFVEKNEKSNKILLP